MVHLQLHNMKIVVFSDIHSDINKKRQDSKFLIKLANYIDSISPEVLIVAGDVASSTAEIQHFFEELKLLKIKFKLYCPGNHDIWVNQKSSDGSWIKYKSLLPDLCNIYGWHFLPNNPKIIDRTAFVGTMGWYDYSMRNIKWDDRINLTTYENKTNPITGSTWMDREFAKFGNYNDKKLSYYFNSDLIDNLNKIGISIKHPDFQNNQISEKINLKFNTIICTSHFVPFKEFIKSSGSLNWDYFNAFMGNLTLGEIINLIPNEYRRISLFGHTHFPQYSRVNGGVEAYCAPLGYSHEWEHDKSIEDMFEARIKVLNP